MKAYGLDYMDRLQEGAAIERTSPMEASYCARLWMPLGREDRLMKAHDQSRALAKRDLLAKLQKVEKALGAQAQRADAAEREAPSAD